MNKLTPRQENYIGNLQHHENRVRKDFKKEYKEYIEVLNDRGKRNLKTMSFDDYLWNKSEKEEKQQKMFPISPKKLDQILKKIGRRKL